MGEFVLLLLKRYEMQERFVRESGFHIPKWGIFNRQHPNPRQFRSLKHISLAWSYCGG